MILKPTEGVGLFKRGGKIRCWIGPITEVDGIASAVFGITGWGRYLGPLCGRLISLGFNVEENTFLEFLGAITTQQSQINAIGCSGTTHGIKRDSSVSMQFNSRLHWHQLIHHGLWVGEMPQQATIKTWLFINALNQLGLGTERQQFRQEQDCGQRH